MKEIEKTSLQIDIMLHEPHSRISWPALLIVVPYYVLIIGIWMLCKVSLYEITSFICWKSTSKKNSHLKKYKLNHRNLLFALVGQRTWKICGCDRCICSTGGWGEHFLWPHPESSRNRLAFEVDRPSHWLCANQAPTGPSPGHSTEQWKKQIEVHEWYHTS